MAKNNKTRFFYVLYSDKTWVFDQSERAQGPIYIIKENKPLSCHIHRFIFRKLGVMTSSVTWLCLKVRFISVWGQTLEGFTAPIEDKSPGQLGNQNHITSYASFPAPPPSQGKDPGNEVEPIYDLCGWHSYPKHKLWRAFVDGLTDNDKKVASSKCQGAVLDINLCKFRGSKMNICASRSYVILEL